MSNIVEATVHVRDIEIFTRTIGSGPTTVVLHGGPGAHHDYLLPQYDALAMGRCLHFYDQRGGGRSSVPRNVPVGWREHVADLDTLLDLWQLPTTTLLGYSWGGLLAILYAIHRPTRVARLALVSSVPASAKERGEFERRFAERMRNPELRDRRRRLRQSGLHERHPEAYRQRMFELSVAPYFADIDRAHDLTPFLVTQRTQRTIWESLGNYDLTDEVRALTLPALVVHGRHDPIPLSAAERLAGLLNARFALFEHSGHVPHIEEPDRFLVVLDEFLPRAP